MADPYYSVTLQWAAAGADEPATAVLRLAGELDINARDEVQASMVEAVTDDRCGVLVVDLAGVAFLDSEAMSALVGGCTVAAGRGVRVRLEGAQGMVDRVLAISGVLDLVQTLNDGPPPQARPAVEE